jgi:hypothetical protein
MGEVQEEEVQAHDAEPVKADEDVATYGVGGEVVVDKAARRAESEEEVSSKSGRIMDTKSSTQEL